MKATRGRKAGFRLSIRFRWFLIASAVATLTVWSLTDQTRRRSKAIATVRHAGGYTLHDNTYRHLLPALPAVKPTVPRWLQARLPREATQTVSVINVDGQPLSDVDLGNFAGLKGLLRLYLNSTRVTDAGLVHLRGLTDLHVLELRENEVGDAGLAHLAGLQHLEELHLSYTRVTDAGLVHLAGLKHLKYLNLSHTAVTDAGLASLAELGELQVLFVLGADVTKAGTLALKQKRPSLTIVQ